MNLKNGNRGFIRGLVHRPLTYRVLRPLLDLLTLREENQAFRIWIHFILEVTRKAYGRKGPVVWMNAFTPTEMVYGLGAVPFMPEIIASLVAYMGQSRRPIALADSRVSTDVCSFYRCALGLVLEGYLPKPDLILSTSYLCDGANKFFHDLSRIYGCPHLMLDPPYNDDPQGRRYMVGQIRDAAEEMTRILGLSWNHEALARALVLSNQARRYMVGINKLRRAAPSPFPGSEGLSYLAGMNFYSLGSSMGLTFYGYLHQELKRRVARNRGYLPQEVYRILWLHHIRPYYRNDIFDFLGRQKAAVSFEEPNYLYWPYLDPHKPWEALAEKILSNIWAGPLERRIRAIEQIVEDYGIDGVIHFSHWGCRQSCGGAGVIGDRLKDKGIPYIILPGDGADPDNYSPGQTRTRVQALVEMLG